MTFSPEQFGEFRFGGCGYQSIHISGKPTPRMYYDFSVADIENGFDDRSRVNALSNAKRALHFQVELISSAFGIEKLPYKERHNFPNKLEFCRKCGVTGERVLNKLNKIRNLVEHEYRIPTKDELEDFIDIVELFLSATDRFVYHFPVDLELEEFSNENKESLPEICAVEMPPNKGVVRLCVWPGKEGPRNLISIDFVERQPDNSIKVHVSDGDTYFKWVRLIVDNSL